MKLYFFHLLLLLCYPMLTSAQASIENHNIDILIIGGGASGAMAGIQAARLGVAVTILEETPWLGGMLTAAGVSAVDGNYDLHSGLWEEFRQQLNKYYGGANNLKTGWVSNVMFEPQVGAAILAKMAAEEKNLTVVHEAVMEHIFKTPAGWKIVVKQGDANSIIEAKIVIDATELGDVAARVGIPYDIGMDSREGSGEAIAPQKANDIVQDLTYVAILKDFGPGTDASIPKPENYQAAPFLCTCVGQCQEDSNGRKLWDCDHMMNYGKLPNGYYMINWPINGNDYYLNIIELAPKERAAAIKKAKEHTLNYLYHLQNELGYRHLGIADDVYPTSDGLPFIPYYRESRRIKGIVRFTVNDLARPFQQQYAFYRTGIAVGDYPVDHHHDAYPDSHLLPDLHFYPVPSYSIPLGALIPKNTDHFIVAEKSISVTNVVNGTTRLQPVCLLIGQAAGVLAALSVKQRTTPSRIQVREVQKELLNAGAYIMPYSDVEVKAPEFKALQRIGAAGILQGEGKNIGWKNHTHIYPDSLLTTNALKLGFEEWMDSDLLNLRDEFVSYGQVMETIMVLILQYQKPGKTISKAKLNKDALQIFQKLGLNHPGSQDYVSRKIFAVLLDELLNPFELRSVDHWGNFMD